MTPTSEQVTAHTALFLDRMEQEELAIVRRAYAKHVLANADLDEPAIGDGDPVRVAGQVGQDSVGSAERSLGIDHPLALAQRGEEGLEGCRLGEGGVVGEELQPPGLVGGRQSFEEQATEEARKHPDGEKEAAPAGNPVFSVRRESAARYDDMGMRMVAPTPTIP